ncbi:MAG TPA: branched-chain amino acid ABC transporter substrate-binding protein [Acidimicrobiia bacterium]|nr:branched-chain amino acid ABC transporter substrate-binding protein [Acidimicrobiia bacterium]
MLRGRRQSLRGTPPNPRAGRLGSAVLVTVVLLGACGGNGDNKNKASEGGSTNGKKTVALGMVGALTGENANLGVNIRDGIRVAIDEWNKKTQKYIYQLKEFDTQGDPAQAPSQKDKYIPDSSILGIVGPGFSGETKAVLPDLEQAGLVMISPSATNAALPTVVPNGKVFHRIIPDDDVQAKGVSDYVTKVIKPKKVALINDNTEYGKGLWGGVVKLLTAAGVDTSVTDSVDPKSQDFSAAVNKIKSGRVDMVFYGGYYSEAGRLKKQLTDAGVKAKFLSGDGSLDPGFIASSGAAGGEGALLTCPCRLATTDLPGKGGDFARSYKALNGRDPGTYSSEGYDAASVLIAGVEAGNDTRAKLLSYVGTLPSFDGVSKTIQFEPNGNVKAGDVFVYEVKGGKLTELGRTSELAK